MLCVRSWLEEVPWACRSLAHFRRGWQYGFPALLAAALVTFAYTVGVPTGGVQASNCKLAVSAFFAEQ
jgi:hypothetical protein